MHASIFNATMSVSSIDAILGRFVHKCKFDPIVLKYLYEFSDNSYLCPMTHH